MFVLFSIIMCGSGLVAASLRGNDNVVIEITQPQYTIKGLSLSPPKITPPTASSPQLGYSVPSQAFSTPSSTLPSPTNLLPSPTSLLPSPTSLLPLKPPSSSTTPSSTKVSYLVLSEAAYYVNATTDALGTKFVSCKYLNLENGCTISPPGSYSIGTVATDNAHITPTPTSGGCPFSTKGTAMTIDSNIFIIRNVGGKCMLSDPGAVGTTADLDTFSTWKLM